MLLVKGPLVVGADLQRAPSLRAHPNKRANSIMVVVFLAPDSVGMCLEVEVDPVCQGHLIKVQVSLAVVVWEVDLVPRLQRAQLEEAGAQI